MDDVKKMEIFFIIPNNNFTQKNTNTNTNTNERSDNNNVIISSSESGTIIILNIILSDILQRSYIYIFFITLLSS